MCDIGPGRDLLRTLFQSLHQFLGVGMRAIINRSDTDGINPSRHHHKIGVRDYMRHVQRAAVPAGNRKRIGQGSC